MVPLAQKLSHSDMEAVGHWRGKAVAVEHVFAFERHAEDGDVLRYSARSRSIAARILAMSFMHIACSPAPSAS